MHGAIADGVFAHEPGSDRPVALGCSHGPAARVAANFILPPAMTP